MQPQYADLKTRLLQIARGWVRDRTAIMRHVGSTIGMPGYGDFLDFDFHRENIENLTTRELKWIYDDFTLETPEDYYRLLTIISLIRIIDYPHVFIQKEREFATRELKYIKEAISLLLTRWRNR
jgi:hypothetical protein